MRRDKVKLQQATDRLGARVVRRIPIFYGAQAQCESCGDEIADPLAVEEFGRFCSARCYHSRGLPVIRGAGG